MAFFRPYSTLLIGVAIGVFVVPRVSAKLGVSVPGA
jgi:hypothetical protein